MKERKEKRKFDGVFMSSGLFQFYTYMKDGAFEVSVKF